MAKQFPQLSSALSDFIAQQKLFFVGSAMDEGRINISPKGINSLKIINPNKLIWLNLTGSGNETAIHLKNNDRQTIMLCSFDKNPLILRIYGKAKAHHRGESIYEEYISHFDFMAGARQIIELDIEMVQTSCGYGVPMMDFKQERTLLKDHGIKKENGGLQAYWNEKNSVSIDGFPSGIFKNEK